MAKTCSIVSLAKRIRQHPRSRRGASLPLVLLLFLVCAMASSIVLAAGTAAAGRAAGLEESDKVYYEVTSAARVFRDELNTQPHKVTIALSKLGATDSPELTILLDGKEITEENQGNFSILEQAAFFALFGSKTGAESVTSYSKANDFLDTAAYFNWNEGDTNSDWNTWLDAFNASFPGKAFDTFSVTTADGKMNLDVRSEVDSEGKLLFKFRESGKTDDLLVLTCTGDYSTQEAGLQNGASIKAVTVDWTPSDIGKAAE